MLSETRSRLSKSHCSSVLACLLPTQSITPFLFLEKDLSWSKKKNKKLDSGGFRDCFHCRTRTHLYCLSKQRLRRVTDLTTIHRKLRGPRRASRELMILPRVCYDSHTELEPTVYPLVSAADVFSLTKRKHAHKKKSQEWLPYLCVERFSNRKNSSG